MTRENRKVAWRNREAAYFDNTVLDSDFDDLGGELTVGQIRSPQEVLYKSSLSPEEKAARAEYYRIRNARKRRKTDLERAADPAPAIRMKDYRCRCCHPYNGHPYAYWGTGQEDIW